ncbi:MAG TPA: PDZ domain-containing protein [Thermoanaerobaculia bacterium]|nr:PDZ domain-containing protein [Thermoanaerobaculia bacterium]
MRPLALAALLFALFAALPAVADPLLRTPALSRTQIAFTYAGDLWVVGREGGEARRLTTGVGVETDPAFSPDGQWLAFTGQYDGNWDVYLIPVAGGVPRRLTWHPGIDRVVGWTPDGKRVLFRSGRNQPFANQLFTVAVEGGGLPAALPFPTAEEGTLSPDGSRLAYVPRWNRRNAPGTYVAWKRYRGGLASPVWIGNLADSAVEEVPHQGSNDFDPQWIGDKVYFLSDRNGPVTLFAYDTVSRKVSQVLENHGADIASASAGPGAIVYDQLGKLFLFDLSTGRSRGVEVKVAGDLPAVRPHYMKVTADRIDSSALSPTGVRAVFEAHGEILTVPAEKGDVRNLTHSPGVAERSPAWSPDGQKIAYFSDESGEYALHIADQTGAGTVKKIDLGNPPSFFYEPKWSPDGKKIAYTDKRLNVWYVDLAKGTPVKVDSDTYDAPTRALDPAWSPDSRFLAYTKTLRNHMGAVFIHALDSGKSTQVTDGMSDARYAVFDKSGKYLYFTASTDVGPTTGWLDMSSFLRPVTRSVYVAVLDKTLPSPLAPLSDEEKDAAVKEGKDGKDGKEADTDKDKGKGKDKEKVPVVKVDFDGIDQRILSLPLPGRNYVSLADGKEGVLILFEAPPVGSPVRGGTVQRFELAKRKTEKLLDGVQTLVVSHDGEKMLVRVGEAWSIVPTAAPPKPGDGALSVEGLEVLVDPPAEWRQMYREVWRLERDFFYDPNLHGLDLKAAVARYQPYVEGVGHRSDLNALFNEMLGEITVGHMYVAGGDAPEVPRVKVGLLGADYEIANGRYRFARIFSGENWNPDLQAPLTQPGVNVKPGEYLLAVGGRELKASDDVYSFFEATAGKSVVIEVGPSADGKGSRKVTVVPVDGEEQLRELAWVEGNRRKVDELSGGRLAYVYLPNTGGAGYSNFNRYFFAQIGREGAVIDERYNGGGAAADYIVDYLRRPLLNYFTSREGEDFTTPVGSIFGPKVMIINESAGSGGDALPWYFRKLAIGPLIGERTWGGLVGIFDYPSLIGGGRVTAPRVAFYNPNGTWDVENHGVAPDVEVELDPKAWRQGHDAQLEKAVQTALDLLAKNPLPKAKRPPYPNYHQPTQTAGAAQPAEPAPAKP